MRQNPHVRICGGPGSATTLVYPTVIARGLNTDSLNGSEFAGNNYNNGVATYLGDIPLAVDLRLHDIERVEVLLGP